MSNLPRPIFAPSTRTLTRGPATMSSERLYAVRLLLVVQSGQRDLRLEQVAFLIEVAHVIEALPHARVRHLLPSQQPVQPFPVRCPDDRLIRPLRIAGDNRLVETCAIPARDIESEIRLFGRLPNLYLCAYIGMIEAVLPKEISQRLNRLVLIRFNEGQSSAAAWSRSSAGRCSAAGTRLRFPRVLQSTRSG